ncbi:MAG: cupin domain-containing protein [Candidatus Zambryskibacteria bacterium]|nr:cupin domain-containing protein [Candidatus Zambryskibacteria bacterium]
MNLSNIKIIPKVWGKELWIHNDEKYCGKVLVLEKDRRCSLHFHKIKHETFFVSKGLVQMELIHGENKNTLIMKPGDVVEIPSSLIHRFTGLEDSEIMEFSTEHFEEDSYRLELSA